MILSNFHPNQRSIKSDNHHTEGARYSITNVVKYLCLISSNWWCKEIQRYMDPMLRNKEPRTVSRGCGTQVETL